MGWKMEWRFDRNLLIFEMLAICVKDNIKWIFFTRTQMCAKIFACTKLKKLRDWFHVFKVLFLLDEILIFSSNLYSWSWFMWLYLLSQINFLNINQFLGKILERVDTRCNIGENVGLCEVLRKSHINFTFNDMFNF